MRYKGHLFTADQQAVNTRGDRRRDHQPYDGQAACIKESCVENTVAVRLDGQRRCRCARQPEVQRKVDVLGGPTATTEVSAVQAEHRLNLARSRETDRGKWLRESIAGF